MSKILSALDTCLLLGKKVKRLILVYILLFLVLVLSSGSVPGSRTALVAAGSVPVAAVLAPAAVLEWWERFVGCTLCPHNHTSPRRYMSNQWWFHQGSSGSPVFCWSWPPDNTCMCVASYSPQQNT